MSRFLLYITLYSCLLYFATKSYQIRSNFFRFPTISPIKTQHGDFTRFATSTLKFDESSNAPTVKPSGTATLPASSANLLKNCIGAGVFSLSSRLSQVSTGSGALLPGSIIVIVMGMWATYNFYMVGETCRITKATTFGDAWSRTVGADTQWIVQAVVTMAPIVSSLAYTIVLTDIFGMMLKTIGFTSSLFVNRNVVILMLMTFLYPICIQEDLSALKSVSLLGIAGHLMAMTVLAVRIKDGSYFPGGIYYAASPMAAAAQAAATTAATTTAVTAAAAAASEFHIGKIFPFASLLSYCLVAHYNAPRYYTELIGKEDNPNKFLQMTCTSYICAAAIYITTMHLGYGLFGPNAASFALNSFNPGDPLATVARLAFGTSVLASFPLIFLTMKNWFVLQAKKRFPILGATKQMAAVLLLFIGFLASKVTDIGIVGSLAGAVFGSTMMFVFPPIMYSKALQQEAEENGKPSPLLKIFFNGVLLAMGACLGLFGTYNTLKPLFQKA